MCVCVCVWAEGQDSRRCSLRAWHLGIQSCPSRPLCSATDGTLLEGSSHLLISSTLKNFHLLTILVVTAEDLGVYTCSVHNALGTAATTAVLRKAGG